MNYSRDSFENFIFKSFLTLGSFRQCRYTFSQNLVKTLSRELIFANKISLRMNFHKLPRLMNWCLLQPHRQITCTSELYVNSHTCTKLQQEMFSYVWHQITRDFMEINFRTVESAISFNDLTSQADLCFSLQEASFFFSLFLHNSLISYLQHLFWFWSIWYHCLDPDAVPSDAVTY